MITPIAGHFERDQLPWRGERQRRKLTRMSLSLVIAIAILAWAPLFAALVWVFRVTFKGREEFRRVWEALDEPTQKAIYRSVTRGRPAPRPELANAAAESARRQRPLAAVMVLFMVGYIPSLWFQLSTGNESQVVGAIFMGLLSLGLAIYGAVMLWTTSKAQRINAEIAAALEERSQPRDMD